MTTESKTHTIAVSTDPVTPTEDDILEELFHPGHLDSQMDGGLGNLESSFFPSMSMQFTARE